MFIQNKKNRKILSAAALIITTLLVGACSVGNDFFRPKTPVDELSSYIHSEGKDHAPGKMAFWWETINDETLNDYIDILLNDNLDLQEAAARVEQAWERRNISAGDFYPALSLSTQASRSFSFPSTASKRQYIKAVDAGLSSSWQLDLFGKIRRQTNAANARYLKAEADREALAHSLVAELVKSRIKLASLQKKLELSQKISNSRSSTLSTVERRYQQGVSDTKASDVYLARENLSSALAIIPELKRQIFNESYNLDLLLGKVPGYTAHQNIALPLLPPPSNTPVGLPASLLDRRPDVRSAEFALQAASEDIGLAIADLYPDLTLTGNIGYDAADFGDIFNPKTLAGSILADLTLKIFQGGKLRAHIRLEEAEAQELAAAYTKTILGAIKDVETALNNEKRLDQQISALQNSVDAIRHAEKLTSERYTKGLGSLLEVLDVQRRLANAEQELLDTAERKWNARIDLYLALGGDWFMRGADNEKKEKKKVN